MSEMTRENARKIAFYGSTLEDCVNWLLKFQEKGESVVVEFNGHNLYSCDVTMDSAYIEITGQTKAEFDAEKEKWRKEYQERQEREKAETEAKIPVWIEKGEALIYPERMEKWQKCVEVRAGDIYNGKDLDAALDLMEKLESGASMEEVKEMFYKQDHSGASAGVVKSVVFHFSKRGPEFYESIARRELSEKETKLIEDKKRENELLEGIDDSKFVKSKFLSAMSKTKSWLSLEDLQIILPQDQYQELLTTVRSGLEHYYAKSNLKDVTQEEVEQEITERISGELFTIGVDELGGFILKPFSLTLDKINRPLDQSQLDAVKLASVVEKTMQKHLDYGVFHTNKHLTAEQIPKVLEFYIDVARKYKSRDIENSNETVEVETEQKDEISEQRQVEEEEIVALASEKEKLTTEFDETEKQLEELRVQEEELKKESKSNEIDEK